MVCPFLCRGAPRQAGCPTQQPNRALALFLILALVLVNPREPTLGDQLVVAGCSEPSGVSRGPAVFMAESEGKKAVVKAVDRPRIPAADQVARMRAEAYAHPFSPSMHDIGPFDVPPERYDDILRYFRIASLDRRAPSAMPQEIGTILVTTKNNAMFRICWFWEGKGTRLAFSWSGVRYCATGDRFAFDETLFLDRVLRHIYEGIPAKLAPTTELPTPEAWRDSLELRSCWSALRQRRGECRRRAN
jgi:hypothetical protein